MPPLLKSSLCGCTNLRAGSFLFGVAHLTYSMVSAVVFVIVPLIWTSLTVAEIDPEPLGVIILEVILYPTHGALAILLLYAISKKRRRRLIVPYIALTIVALIVSVFLDLTDLPHNHFDDPLDKMLTLHRVLNLLFGISSSYFLLIVYSYYQKLVEGDSQHVQLQAEACD